jgi:hypothetical protein
MFSLFSLSKISEGLPSSIMTTMSGLAATMDSRDGFAYPPTVGFFLASGG